MVAYVDHTTALNPGTAGIITGTSAVTLPTHAAGDRMLLYVSGKPDTAAIPTINQGWTLLQSGTGGTGAAGVDVGSTYYALFGKDATSSSETAPTLTYSSPATNVSIWNTLVYRPGTGATWADAIATSAAWVVSVSDTTAAASPLTGTTSAFPNAPIAGDAIVVFGSTPTDSTIWTSTTLTVTGLSGGTVSGHQSHSTTGNDMSNFKTDWVDFAGTASSGVDITFNFSAGSNTSGPITAVHLRQTAAFTGTSAVAPVVAIAATGTPTGASTVATTSAVATSGTGTGTSARTVAVAIATTGTLLLTGTSAVDPSVSIATTGALGVPGVVAVDTAATITTVGNATGSTALAPSVAIATTGTLTGSAAVAPVVSLATTGTARGTSAVTVAATISTTGLLILTGTSTRAVTVAIATTGFLDTTIYGDTSNSDDGLHLDGTALVEWEPAVVTTPTRYQNILAMDTARAIQLTGIGPHGQPLITKLDKRVARARDRILLGGVDITYLRGVKTPTPDYRLIKPLLWGSATLVLPQINPQYERLGPHSGVTGALRKIEADALVVVQRVLDDVVVATDYVGFVDAINTGGSVLSLTLGGHASGRASNDIEPPPVFRAKHDLKFQVLNYLQTLNLHTADTDGTIGISIYDRGGSDGLTLVNELVALAVTSDGDTFDVMPDDDRVYDMTQTDRETIHATVYLDDNLATQQLDRAFSEEPNVVYATSRTASGLVVNNAKAPGLVQYAPDFLIPLEQGDSGATSLNSQLTVAGYLNYEDSDDIDLFDLDTYYAVVEFQYDAGLPTDGVVDGDTWNALWNIADVGYTINQARIHPMAQRSYTRKFNFAGNGSKLGENPDWDVHRIKRAVSLDFGSGINRRRNKRMAQSRLAPANGSNWQGTLTLPSGVIAGEHTPGDPITADDVMPARALRPGMNIWMPLFDGGTLFHIATADVTNDGANVELHIDTQARDSIPLWEVIARNRETRSSPARRVSGQVRRSQIMQDSVTEWTDICGILPAQTPLQAEQWTEIMVPAGQEGIVNHIRTQLGEKEYAILLTQKAIPGGPAISTPLTDPRPSERPWWERPAVVDILKGYGYLAAWGTPQQPCGYDPGLKNDDQGPTGDEITGLFREEAGLNYSAAEPGRLYLYIWVAEATFLQPGKLLEQQLTPGI